MIQLFPRRWTYIISRTAITRALRLARILQSMILQGRNVRITAGPRTDGNPSGTCCRITTAVAIIVQHWPQSWAFIISRTAITRALLRLPRILQSTILQGWKVRITAGLRTDGSGSGTCCRITPATRVFLRYALIFPQTTFQDQRAYTTAGPRTDGSGSGICCRITTLVPTSLTRTTHLRSVATAKVVVRQHRRRALLQLRRYCLARRLNA
jgi:hypothetical protein